LQSLTKGKLSYTDSSNKSYK